VAAPQDRIRLTVASVEGHLSTNFAFPQGEKLYLLSLGKGEYAPMTRAIPQEMKEALTENLTESLAEPAG
jgi:hypothetical protein